MPTKVQSSNLNEELGQVEYIFSDKTGTLTQNIMEFKKMCIGNYSYGLDGNDGQASASRSDSIDVGSKSFDQESPKPDISQPAAAKRTVPNVNFTDPTFFEHMRESSHPKNTNIQRFMLHLALCHTVIAEAKDKDGQLTTEYNASSPDELALVNAARFFGFVFKERDFQNNIHLELPDESSAIYETLNVIEFDSTRKRMTVIVKCPDESIKVMCKGADSIIEKRLLDKSSMVKTNEYLEKYAESGLRTLLLAEKTISEEEYASWQEKYDEASLATVEREAKMGKVADEIEYSFELVGATAIEDRLQDDVADTISVLKEAGIKVWVLTGDKIETAINIGYSCKVLNNEMEQFIIDATDPTKISDQLMDAHKDFRKSKRDSHGLIVAGETLLRITEDEDLCEDFQTLADRMKVVIACRVSPKQKAEIVELVKNKYPEKRTLAIGDGANDVNMITAAHIGVGISGLEGQQAARASDYAIGQFKFLRNLLFVHGRESYRKNSYVVCYMFYKDVLFVMCIFWYGTVSAFSGLTIFEQWLYQLYNILFSCFPIMWFAVFDYELPKQVLSKHPKYYIYTVNPTLTNYKFGRWIFYAVWQSIVLCILAFFPFESQGGSFWMEGNFVYLGVVLIVNIKILCDTSNHTLVSLIFAIGSILMFLGGTVAVNYIKITELYGTLEQTLPSFEFYYILILILLAIVQIDIGVNYVNRQLRKRIIRVVHKLQKNLKFPRFRKSKIGQEKKPKKKIHRGFAFAQDPGNAPLVVEKLWESNKNRRLTISGKSRINRLLNASEGYRHDTKSQFISSQYGKNKNNQNYNLFLLDKIIEDDD